MKRISVDIGGTFTDCFVAWDGRYVQAKALTTHHNLSQGFNEALDQACTTLNLRRNDVLRDVDSVRYATTLGTNALIERRGPRVGVVVSAGFDATIPLSRGRGYGEGLDELAKNDMSSGTRPDPLVPQTLIRSVRERVDYSGAVVMELDTGDIRRALRELIDAGAEALVVCLTNATENPAHELRVQEVFLSEYPAHQLGAIPMLLSHQLSGRKGEYVRATSAIVDGFLHATMYHALSDLEQNLREHGYPRPMLIIHNSGGMAQLNSTDALQTIHSGPVAGISASEALAGQAGLGNVVATDMGGTSYDIGLVPADGVKHYDFMPVIDRWLVSVPMIHLVTLGAGGGSIASYDRLHQSVKVGPRSAGSDPGPACSDNAAVVSAAGLRIAGILYSYIDQTSEEVVSAYEAEKENWLRNQSAARAARVRALLRNEPVDVDSSEAILGYRLRQRHLGVVAWMTGAAAGGDSIGRLEHATTEMAAGAHCDGRPMFIPQDEFSAWAWLPLGVRRDIAVPATNVKNVPDSDGIRFALGEPAPGVTGFRRTHQQALSAQAVALAAGPSGQLMTGFGEVAPLALMSGSIELLQAWVIETLGALAADDENTARLRDTLRVFLQENGSYKTTAERLVLHKNTVQYRVRKAEEGLGRPVGQDRLHVELALLASQWLGAAVLRPADEPTARAARSDVRESE